MRRGYCSAIHIFGVFVPSVPEGYDSTGGWWTYALHHMWRADAFG
jgi:hypothetical protein